MLRSEETAELVTGKERVAALCAGERCGLDFPPFRTKGKVWSKVLAGLLGTVLAVVPFTVATRRRYSREEGFPQQRPSKKQATGLVEVAGTGPLFTPVIPGVNFGGWLCLEDWFMSGGSGRYVDSGWPFEGQGICLPTEKTILAGYWQSEGTLTKLLGDAAVSAIEAHRASFISEVDFQQAAALGIKTIRVPLTWAAFADALAPGSPGVYGQHNPDIDTVIVPDPHYFEDIAMATIPRRFLSQIMDWAAANKLQVLWDIHAYMGGSSNGTFNGVWPREPAFWRGNFALGNLSLSLFEAGLWVAQAAIQWAESLNAERLATIGGLCLMNEPAHLSVGAGWASEGQILDWLTKTSIFFRSSTLPAKGIKLYINVMDTAFRNWDVGFKEVVQPWWYETFSAVERNQWAVMDRHKYWAWDPECSGCTAGPPNCGWMCTAPVDELRAKIQGCVKKWVDPFVEMFPDGLKAVTEFSKGTFRDASLACVDDKITHIYYEEQVSAFLAAGLEPFFWTWRMPYAPIFEAGWSLKHAANLEDSALAAQCQTTVGHHPETVS